MNQYQTVKQITDFDGSIIGYQIDGPGLGENGLIVNAAELERMGLSV